MQTFAYNGERMAKPKKKRDRLVEFTRKEVGEAEKRLQKLRNDYMQFVDVLTKADFNEELAIDGGNMINDSIDTLILQLAKLKGDYDVMSLPRLGRATTR